MAKCEVGFRVTAGDDIIRASEVGQYVYCARAWWLARALGYRSANLSALATGLDSHRAHGRAVERYHVLRRMASLLLLLSVAALAAWILLSFAK